MTEKFGVELLEEAIEFVESIDSKSREKIFFNIEKAQFINDEELFKKLKGNIWEFSTLYN